MEHLKIKENILNLVKEYPAKFKQRPFEPGKSIVRYAGRVFDELVNLVDSSLDFGLLRDPCRSI